MGAKYKPILCLDFDGVVHSYTSGWKGPRTIPDPPVPGALAFMHEALLNKWDVCIFSSRGHYWGGRRAMRRWLYNNAMWANRWDEVMGNPGLENVRFPRHKPPAMVTIDDRALTFDGTWPDLEALALFCPWNKK